MKSVNEIVCEFIGTWPSRDMEAMAKKSDDYDRSLALMNEYNDVAYSAIEKIISGEPKEAAEILKSWEGGHPELLIQGNSVRYILEKLLESDQDGRQILEFMDNYRDFIDRKIEIVERTVKQDFYRNLLDVDEKKVMTVGEGIMAPVVNLAVMAYRSSSRMQRTVLGVGDETSKKLMTIADSFLAPSLGSDAHSFLLKTFYDLGDIESFGKLIDRGVNPNVNSYIRPYRSLIHEMIMDASDVENAIGFFKKLDGRVQTDVIDATSTDFPFPVSLAVREKDPDLVEWCLNQPDVPWEWLTHKNIDHAFEFGGFDVGNDFSGATERASATRDSGEVQAVIDNWFSRTGRVIEEKQSINIGSPLDIDMDW